MADNAEREIGAEVSRETLRKMTKDELSAYAMAVYGQRLYPTEQHKEEMIDFIMSSARKFKGNAEMKVVKMNEDVEVPEGYVKIRVSPGEHNPNNRPIPVGLNFRLATIPVNRDVVMHGRWLPCLEDAVARKYFVGRDEQGDETLAWNDQHRYPFSVIVDNRKRTAERKAG